jgi:exopolysaccharide biosynthesis WecB/TagA/CpsF family protein
MVWNQMDKGIREVVKDAGRRVLDLTLVAGIAPAAGLLATSAAATLLLNGKRSILQGETRVGRRGRLFRRWKFRTLPAPRRLRGVAALLGRLGAFDTPVLWNVLRGNLSFVGPEPVTPSEAINRSDTDPRFQTRPGMTSPYQLRRNMNLPDLDQDLIELRYFAERSAATDLGVLLKSVPAWLLGRTSPVHRSSFRMLDVELGNFTLTEAIRRLDELVVKRQRHVAFANPHCFNIAQQDPEYGRILKEADLVLPDGVGIKLAGGLIGAELRENLNGTDLFPKLCDHARHRGQTIFLVGAAPGVAEAVKERMTARYPGLSIVGARDGYFDPGSDDELATIAEINATRPDYLLVARGVPEQEKWIDTHRESMDFGVAMGVGGLFDFYSGRITRAPLWVREIGLEWLWRFGQEPRRMFHRYFVGNPRFLLNVWRWHRSLSQTRLTDHFADLDRSSRRFAIGAGFQLRRGLWWLATDGALALKRATDVLAAGIGLVLLSPLLGATAAAIKLEDSAGPVFYTQQRVGQRGQPFPMYKFRSMITGADKMKVELAEQNESAAGVTFKMKDDPRITRTGKIIRKYSIDELPQLWNVFTGDMSVVGPRPPIPNEVAQYQVGDRYRLEVVPGLTCIWQVSGRSDIPFDQQVVLDRNYIRSQSLWQDVKLIARTFPVVLTGSGAY